MLKYDIPGQGKIEIEHLVLDYNGTIAIDGQLIEGVKDSINRLSDMIEVHVITADTFGNAKEQLHEIKCSLAIISNEFQDEQKSEFVRNLGREKTVSVGNGRNDKKMLKVSRLGICVIQEECAYLTTLLESDIISKNILDCFNLLMDPLRMKALLRN